MQPLTVINDTHLGALRSSGTTPTTMLELRQKLQRCFADLLTQVTTDLCILGDLFDTGHVPLSDLFATWGQLRAWLGTTGNRLILVQGNHDLEKNLTAMSSFQLLGSMLKAELPDKVRVVSEPTLLAEYGAYIIPHLPNQDLFNEALKQVPAVPWLLLHCNYDNHFAVESDHSLNLSQEQAIECKAESIVLAHEHQAAIRLEGKVNIIGNQFPSSVADCLGNHTKKYLRIEGRTGTSVLSWEREGSYSEQDWQSLEDKGDFIRVVGSASAEQAADVVSAIAKFRSKAKALVITNAVQIEGVNGGEEIAASLEEVKNFNVLDALLECLDEREQAVVKSLLKPKDAA